MKEEKKAELWELFKTFFKIGLCSFGGGYVIVPLIHKEASETHSWISKNEITEIISVASSMPGALAMNASVHVGYYAGGTAGAFTALAGCVIPSILLMLIVTIFMSGVSSHPVFIAALKGIVPVVTGMMVTAMVKLGKNSLRDWGSALIFLAALLLTIFNKGIVIYVLLGSAALGVLFSIQYFSGLARKAFVKGGEEQ